MLAKCVVAADVLVNKSGQTKKEKRKIHQREAKADLHQSSTLMKYNVEINIKNSTRPHLRVSSVIGYISH